MAQVSNIHTSPLASRHPGRGDGCSPAIGGETLGFPFESSKLVTPFCGYFIWIGGSNIFQEKTVDGSEMRR